MFYIGSTWYKSLRQTVATGPATWLNAQRSPDHFLRETDGLAGWPTRYSKELLGWPLSWASSLSWISLSLILSAKIIFSFQCNLNRLSFIYFFVGIWLMIRPTHDVSILTHLGQTHGKTHSHAKRSWGFIGSKEWWTLLGLQWLTIAILFELI